MSVFRKTYCKAMREVPYRPIGTQKPITEKINMKNYSFTESDLINSGVNQYDKKKK